MARDRAAQADQRENDDAERGQLQGVSGPTPSPAQATPAAVKPQSATSPQDSLQRMHRVEGTSLAIIATAVVLGGLYLAKLPAIVLLTSILLAFVLAPLVELLMRIRLPRAVASLIAVALFLAAMYGLVYVSYNSAVNFANDLPRYSAEIKRMTLHVRQRAEQIQKTTETVLPSAETDGRKTVAVSRGGTLSDFLRDNFGSVTETALMVSFVPFLTYFMLSWQEHARTATVMLFRTHNRTTAYVAVGLISSMIRSFIVGNVLVGLFIGSASLIVFGVLHIPYFYFLGYISGFLSLVPYLGVPLALIPPLLAGLGKMHSGGVLAIVITVLALHLFSMNVLYPKFLGSRLQLNPLAVTVALLFWGWLWGAMGLVLAIPITGAMKIVLDHVEPLRPYGAWLGE